MRTAGKGSISLMAGGGVPDGLGRGGCQFLGHPRRANKRGRAAKLNVIMVSHPLTTSKKPPCGLSVSHRCPCCPTTRRCPIVQRRWVI